MLPRSPLYVNGLADKADGSLGEGPEAQLSLSSRYPFMGTGSRAATTNVSALGTKPRLLPLPCRQAPIIHAVTTKARGRGDLNRGRSPALGIL